MVDFVSFRIWRSESSAPSTGLLRLIDNWRKRRRMRQILELEDHILKDIGLNRHDVRLVLDQPLSIDPVQALERRSQSRRKKTLPDATRRWLHDAAYAHPRIDEP